MISLLFFWNYCGAYIPHNLKTITAYIQYFFWCNNQEHFFKGISDYSDDWSHTDFIYMVFLKLIGFCSLIKVKQKMTFIYLLQTFVQSKIFTNGRKHFFGGVFDVKTEYL